MQTYAEEALMAIKETLKEKGDANLKKELRKFIKEYSLYDVQDPEDLSEILALAEEYVKTDIQTGGEPCFWGPIHQSLI